MFDKIVLITRKTRLVELVERFNTLGQAKFYIEHAGGDFSDYVKEDERYRDALESLYKTLSVGMPVQIVDRGFLPTFLFGPNDLVVTLGQDGLVANTARYAAKLPIVGVNPDVERFDGVLLPFTVQSVERSFRTALEGRSVVREVTMAQVALQDGQKLVAFNDLFLGASSHVSARYRLTLSEASEVHSSSGVIVSTGAGSTGWLSSVFNMSAGVAGFLGGQRGTSFTMKWEDPRLCFVVREPFASRRTSVSLVAGMINGGQSIHIESLMPSGGVIFCDGVESDRLAFNAGAVATIRAAEHRARLVVG